MDSCQVVDDNIMRLPPQLLARILSHCPVATRLRDCAMVCQAWRTAAIMATSSISVQEGDPDKGAALSGWLQANGVIAAVSSISFTGPRYNRATLQLPTQQLQTLRELNLTHIRAAVAPADMQQQQQQQQQVEGEAPVLAVLGPELSGLSKLHLNDCEFSLEGLQSLTGLCDLAIQGQRVLPTDAINTAQLALVLPALTRLTSVALNRPASNEVVRQHLSALPDLQHVSVVGDAAALAAMPATLTSLELHNRVQVFGQADSRTRLRQLSNLQQLKLDDVRHFHPAVLAGLTGLRTLLVHCMTVSKGDADELGLEVLSTLTNLQDLSLMCGEVRPEVATEEGFAALTAPSALTALRISRVPAAAGRFVFPEGQHPLQLRHLAVLDIDAAVLRDRMRLDRVIAKCPNLRQLTLDGSNVFQPEDDIEQAALAFQRLAACTFLTRLVFFEASLTRKGWGAVAALPHLRSLEIHDWQPVKSFHILELISCRSLTQLYVQGNFEQPDVCFKIDLQAADDQRPPDVWRRLPAAAMREAARVMSYSWGEPFASEIFNRLAKDVGPSLAILQSEQQQQVTALEQQVEDLQQEVTGLRRELQLSRAAAEALQRDRQQLAILQEQMREVQAALGVRQMSSMQAE